MYLDTVDLLWPSALKLTRSFSQLVSTSNKRPSSGEMKKDQKRVDIYREMDLTPILIKDDLWRLIFKPFWEVDWSVISVIWGVERLVQLSLTPVNMFSHLFGMHQQWFEGVYPLETNLYGHVFEDLLEGLTQTRKIRNWDKELFLDLIPCFRMDERATLFRSSTFVNHPLGIIVVM